MYVILEYNGIGAESIMGLSLNLVGVPRTWKSFKEAKQYARKNCAFNYKIVQLTGVDSNVCVNCASECNHDDTVIICRDCAVDYKIVDKY